MNPEIAARLRELASTPAAIAMLERTMTKPARVVTRAPAPAPKSAIPFVAPAAAPAPLAPSVGIPPELELLTVTERRARGLKPARNARISKTLPYRFALVQFENGIRMVAGMYPRAVDSDSLAPAIASARARYLLILSGGRFIDAAKAAELPRVVSAGILSDPVELERVRAECLKQRLALQNSVEGFSELWAPLPGEGFKYPVRGRRRRRA